MRVHSVDIVLHVRFGKDVITYIKVGEVWYGSSWLNRDISWRKEPNPHIDLISSIRYRYVRGCGRLGLFWCNFIRLIGL